MVTASKPESGDAIVPTKEECTTSSLSKGARGVHSNDQAVTELNEEGPGLISLAISARSRNNGKLMTAKMGSVQMFLILVTVWGTALAGEAGLNKGHLWESETIALEQYGVVLRPGKLMSNADVTHVQQGFLIDIPKERPYNKANYDRACHQFVRAGLPQVNHACTKVQTLMDWMHLTSSVLRKQLNEVVKETLEALQKSGEETAINGEQDQPKRKKRLSRLPGIMDDLGWPAFPIPTSWNNNGLASDVKYNRELIKVLQQSTGEALEDLAGLTNRTEAAIARADKLTMSLIHKVRTLNSGQNSTTLQIRRLAYEIDGLGVALNMLPIALEDKLGEILYLQSLIRQAFVFRKGIQHLTRGQLAMDLVPREYMQSAVSEVNRYLQQSYSRFHVAFTNPSFYYENSQPLFTYNQTGSQLTVFVRIPVVADEHLFRIYEVLTFPVPLAVQGRTQKDALQIVNLPTSVAVSMSGQYYVPLTSSSWSGCYGQYITLCKDVPYMKKITDTTCTAALLRQDSEGITERCELDYLLNADFGEMAVYLDDGDVLVVSADLKGQMICRNQPAIEVPIENYARVQVECDCAFQTRGSWIPYSLRNCDHKTKLTKVQYPHNDLLKVKTNTEGWELNITELIGSEAPNVLEDDPIPNQIRQDLLEIEGNIKTRISMRALAKKIQKHKVDMTNNVKKATDRYKVAKMTPWFSIGKFGGGFGLVTIFIIIIVVAIIGCVAWKCWQRHQAKAAMAGLAMAFPRAMALEQADPGVLLVRERTLTGCPDNPGDAATVAALAVLLATLVIMVATIAWLKRRQLRRRTIDGLYIQLVNPHLLETIFLGELAMPHDHAYTEGCVLVRDVVVNQLCLKYTLTVTWGVQLMGAATRPGQQPSVIPLPDTIQVSRKLARLMMGNMKNATRARLLKYSAGLATPVPMGVPRLIDAGWSDVGADWADQMNRTVAVPNAPPRTLPSTEGNHERRAAPSHKDTGSRPAIKEREAVYEALV